ncbi:MAG: hypothetical protein GWO28_10495, partial [candidate division Zixibacteria bacterium]|nr:hypothetical protein [candidate division Zixibacteria bacterium]
MKDKLFYLFGYLVDTVEALIAWMLEVGLPLIGISLIVLIAYTSCAKPVKAETLLQVHLTSYHVDREKQRNEKNFGLGIKHILSNKTEMSIGAYKNSQYNTSVYASFGRLFSLTKHLSAGFEAGLINGYSFTDGRFG